MYICAEPETGSSPDAEPREEQCLRPDELLYTYIYVCIYIYICVCMYIYTYIHIYIHTHTHTDLMYITFKLSRLHVERRGRSSEREMGVWAWHNNNKHLN